MNANGMARGYMAKGMEEKKFLSYVLSCVERELMEWGYDVKVTSSWNHSRTICSVQFIINNKGYSLTIDQPTVKQLQSKGPYALDRIIWDELKSNGINLKEEYYLNTVYKL